MDAYALFDALTDVRDGFLEETERRLHGKKRWRVGMYLLAAVLIVLLCFSSAVALDADFRQRRVLSLFQVAEVVPTQTSQSVTLADGLQADYVFVPAYARTEGGMFIVCTDEVEMKQGSHYAAYAYENGQLVLQENHRFDQTYTVQDKTCRLMFDWAEHDGRAAITWALTADEQRRMGGEENWRLEGGLTTQYRVKLGNWPVTIDLRTGALTDPLAGYDTSQFPKDAFVETWPDEQGRCLLAQLVSTSPYRLTRYYFDGTDVTPLPSCAAASPVTPISPAICWCTGSGRTTRRLRAHSPRGGSIWTPWSGCRCLRISPPPPCLPTRTRWRPRTFCRWIPSGSTSIR